MDLLIISLLMLLTVSAVSGLWFYNRAVEAEAMVEAQRERIMALLITGQRKRGDA